MPRALTNTSVSQDPRSRGGPHADNARNHLAWNAHTISFSLCWQQMDPPNYIWHRLILKFICVPSNSCCRGWGWGVRNILAGHPKTKIFVADNLYVDGPERTGETLGRASSPRQGSSGCVKSHIVFI